MYLQFILTCSKCMMRIGSLVSRCGCPCISLLIISRHSDEVWMGRGSQYLLSHELHSPVVRSCRVKKTLVELCT